MFFYSVLPVPQNGQLYCYWALVLVNIQEQHSADIHIEFLNYFSLGKRSSFVIEDTNCSVQLPFGNTHLGWLSGTRVSSESSVIVIRNPQQTPGDFVWVWLVGLHSVTTDNSYVSESIFKSGIFMQALLRTVLLRICLLKTAALFCGAFLCPNW